MMIVELQRGKGAFIQESISTVAQQFYAENFCNINSITRRESKLNIIFVVRVM